MKQVTIKSLNSDKDFVRGAVLNSRITTTNLHDTMSSIDLAIQLLETLRNDLTIYYYKHI